ncbi:MAG: imidazoleglycerol-phosphate dehydratase [Myxococcota bacterium]
MTSLTRRTKETTISVSLGDAPRIDTGLPFFDHMLTALAAYSGLPLVVHARGDLKHHLMEDVALALGTFIRQRTPATAARYGERTIPMDDALVQAVIDVGGRAYFVGKLPGKLYTHWFRSFATACEATLHLRVLRGKDRHHITEAAFKALGLALRQALRDDGVVFSTKGSVTWETTP